jgi:hypothetical protein
MLLLKKLLIKIIAKNITIIMTKDIIFPSFAPKLLLNLNPRITDGIKNTGVIAC